MPSLRSSVALPWLIAIVGFPIGGTLGNLVAGPAATAPAALISGLIAGVVIGLAQALALGLRSESLVLWPAATGAGLGIGLAIVTAAIGQIETTTEAIVLGAVSGVVIGAAQAALLMRQRIANAWLWIPATGLAWAVGWLITSSVGVALAPGWPNYGLTGAIASQVITAVALWRLVPSRDALTASA
jgi:hypothetical protein